MPIPSRISDVPSSPQDNVRARMTLARKWSYLLLGTVAIPMGSEELERELSGRLDALCATLHMESFDTAPVERAGADLAALGYLGRHGLRCTAEVLGKGLLALPEFQPVERYAERIALAMGALGCGFTGANTESVLTQQESMQRSLLKAVRDANWNLKESEARFNEVVTSSASGVLIVDLDGRLLKVNAAVGDILGHTPDELTGTPLLDLIAPGFGEMLQEALADLVDGTAERIRQSQRMLRKDGEAARLTLTASLLRGANDEPNHFVVVVEDGTELELLQSELKRQALHDALTGLPNRQYFTTQLEIALRKADPEHGITIFHLDLDAFGMVCDSFGGRVAERLLQHVAQRLKVLLAGEKAMIARFGGDEFGILVENTATTPGIGTIMKSINGELLEPTYVDGNGLAVSVSAGVVHRPGNGTEPADAAARGRTSVAQGQDGPPRAVGAVPPRSGRRGPPGRRAGRGNAGCVGERSRSPCGTGRSSSWPVVRSAVWKRRCTGTGRVSVPWTTTGARAWPRRPGWCCHWANGCCGPPAVSRCGGGSAGSSALRWPCGSPRTSRPTQTWSRGWWGRSSRPGWRPTR